jgi:Holliday junction resolvase
MPNSNYIKGRKKEYAIIKELRTVGFDIVQRTAGSHSPIDIIAIDKINKKILFTQSKPDNFSKSESDKIKKELNYLNGLFKCEFIIR